jgi:hypothetical protein
MFQPGKTGRSGLRSPPIENIARYGEPVPRRRDQWMIARRMVGVAAFAGQDVGGLVRDPDRNQYCKVELFGHWRTAAVLAAVAAVVADYAKIKQGQGSEL